MRKEHRGDFRFEAPAREREDGPRARREHDRLSDDEHLRRRRDESGGSEDGKDRVDVRREAARLLAGSERCLEEATVPGVPDGLHHVPEIEAGRAVLLMSAHREHGVADRPGGGRDQHERCADASRQRHCMRPPARGRDIDCGHDRAQPVEFPSTAPSMPQDVRRALPPHVLLNLVRRAVMREIGGPRTLAASAYALSGRKSSQD